MGVTSELGEVVHLNNRVLDRAPVELRAVVQVKENEKDTWKEVTDIKSVSRNGARVYASASLQGGPADHNGTAARSRSACLRS